MLEELFNRVSIRHYQNREVEQAKLEEMLRAAMNAPTARNTQSWRFLVITNRETLNHMTELQPYTGMMKEAYCAILVMGDRNANPVDEYLYVDAAAAIENMLIEGVHQGLGTCWCAVGPVSYTHLDVYKRQDGSYSMMSHKSFNTIGSFCKHR